MVKIERLPSGSYRARVHLGGGKYKSITGKDKKAVQLEAAQVEANIEAVIASEKDPNRAITVGEAISKYIESKKNVLSPATYREYLQVQKNNFDEIKDLPLAKLTQEQIQIEINKLSASNAPKTVRNKYGVLSSTIAMFRPDFAYRVTLPQKKKNEIIIPTEADMMALFEATYGTALELPILLGSISGLRLSEIIALRWNCVDFKRRTIRIQAAKVRDENLVFVEKTTKSVAGTRTIRILPHMYDALRRHYSEDREFVTELTYSQIYERYQSALAKCCPGKHYTFHELRHYAASVMIMLGIPCKYIADYLGHETEDMVNRVYGHIMADKQDMMFEKVEAYYETVLSGCKFEKSDTKSDTKQS